MVKFKLNYFRPSLLFQLELPEDQTTFLVYVLLSGFLDKDAAKFCKKGVSLAWDSFTSTSKLFMPVRIIL